MRKRVGKIFGASLWLMTCAALAQTVAPAKAPAARPVFEVASIKASPPIEQLAAEMRAGRMPKLGATIEGGRATYNFMSLRELVGFAYGLKEYQVAGPDWMGTLRFNITAKLPEGASEDDAPAMLETLLEDRFKLQAHRSTEEHAVLALVVGKGGPKLKEATLPATPLDLAAPLKPGELKINMGDGPAIVSRKPDASTVVNMGERGTFSQTMDMQSQALHIKGENLTMDGFADLLTRVSTIGPAGAANVKQVVNLTGLPGHYQVVLDLSLADLMAAARAQGMAVPGAVGGAAGEASDPSGSGASISSSVKALGLRLEPHRAPVVQLTIDHIEKTPTED